MLIKAGKPPITSDMNRNKTLKRLWADRNLLLMLAPMVVFLVIFNYWPMYGIVISFQDYSIGNRFISFGSDTVWVGLRNFIRFFESIYFFRVIRNAFLNSVLGIVCGFWIPIVFALMLNEIRNKTYKKLCQTISYLPHFISTVIIVGIIFNMLAERDGVINNIIAHFGGKRIAFFAEPKYFRTLYIGSGIWKSFGWNSIIYLAVISGIQQELYDAAKIDGANRMGQILHVTIPGIMPTIVLLLVLSTGSLLSSDTEKILLMYNPLTYVTADVLGTYIYRTGFGANISGSSFVPNYSYAAAVGLFASIVNFTLLAISNKIAGRASDYGLW